MNYTNKQVVGSFCLALAFMSLMVANGDQKLEQRVNQAKKLESSKMAALNAFFEFKPWIMLEMFKTYERAYQLNARIDKDRDAKEKALAVTKDMLTELSASKNLSMQDRKFIQKSLQEISMQDKELVKKNLDITQELFFSQELSIQEQELVKKYLDTIKEQSITKESSVQDKELIKKSLRIVLTPVRDSFTVVKDKANLIKPLLEESLRTKNTILGKFFDSKNDELFFDTEVTTKDRLQQICKEYMMFFNSLELSLSPLAMTKYQQEKTKYFAARDKAEQDKKSKKE